MKLVLKKKNIYIYVNRNKWIGTGTDTKVTSSLSNRIFRFRFDAPYFLRIRQKGNEEETESLGLNPIDVNSNEAGRFNRAAGKWNPLHGSRMREVFQWVGTRSRLPVKLQLLEESGDWKRFQPCCVRARGSRSADKRREQSPVADQLPSIRITRWNQCLPPPSPTHITSRRHWQQPEAGRTSSTSTRINGISPEGKITTPDLAFWLESGTGADAGDTLDAKEPHPPIWSIWGARHQYSPASNWVISVLLHQVTTHGTQLTFSATSWPNLANRVPNYLHGSGMRPFFFSPSLPSETGSPAPT